MVAREGCEDFEAPPTCSTPASVAEAAWRKMTSAVVSGLQPAEADVCNPQTCSGLLEGLLLPLLPDMAAGSVLHNMQLYSRSGKDHCSRQIWTVLQQACSGASAGGLLFMTCSAM